MYRVRLETEAIGELDLGQAERPAHGRDIDRWPFERSDCDPELREVRAKHRDVEGAQLEEGPAARNDPSKNLVRLAEREPCGHEQARDVDRASDLTLRLKRHPDEETG